MGTLSFYRCIFEISDKIVTFRVTRYFLSRKYLSQIWTNWWVPAFSFSCSTLKKASKVKTRLPSSLLRSDRVETIFFRMESSFTGNCTGLEMEKLCLPVEERKIGGDEVEKLPCHAATSSPSLISLWPHWK